MAEEILRPNATGDEENIRNASPDVDHYLNVDEEVSDEYTTNLNENALPGYTFYRDLYNLDATSGSGTINKITVSVVLLNGTGFDSKYTIAVKTGGVVDESAQTVYAPATWGTRSQEWAENPDTETAWTWDDLDSLQAGVSLAAYGMGGQMVVTQLYVVVDYTAAATGTNFQVQIGEAWKAVPAMQIQIGGAWKAVEGAQINIGDTWKTIF